MDACTVSRAISEAVIGAQIGDGELNHQDASAHDRPAERAIFSAWTSTERSMLSNSPSGRSRHRRRPVMPCSQEFQRALRARLPGSSARVGGAGSMQLILPH